MLYITNDGYKTFTFSGGEEHVELLSNVLDFEIQPVTIVKKVKSSADIMQLLLLTEIVRRKGFKEVHLIMPYIPYARQDRATTPGTARSLKVFADLLNSCHFESVMVIDPHSMVSENLINNMVQLDVVPYLTQFLHKLGDVHAVFSNTVLVSPDVGALKKVEKYAKEIGINQVMAFHKERNPATGEIKSIKVISGTDIDVSGKHVVIVDDICDGGRTFIELVKAYPLFKYSSSSRAAESLSLFVTHGIFSQGLDTLFDAGFTRLGSTDSFRDTTNFTDPRLTIIPLNVFNT